jgi:hypothetical protein
MAEDGVREVTRSVDRPIGYPDGRALAARMARQFRRRNVSAEKARAPARDGVTARVDSLRQLAYGVLLMVKVLVPTLWP